MLLEVGGDQAGPLIAADDEPEEDEDEVSVGQESSTWQTSLRMRYLESAA